MPFVLSVRYHMNATDKKSKAAATTAAPQHEKSTHTDGLGNDGMVILIFLYVNLDYIIV